MMSTGPDVASVIGSVMSYPLNGRRVETPTHSVGAMDGDANKRRGLRPITRPLAEAVPTGDLSPTAAGAI